GRPVSCFSANGRYPGRRTMWNTRYTYRLGGTLSVGLVLLLCPLGRAQDPKAAGKPEGEKATAAQPGAAGFSPLDFQALANHKLKVSFRSEEQRLNSSHRT